MGNGKVGTISVFCRRGWDSASAWHSAQSNHFRPGAINTYDSMGGRTGLTAWRSDRNLGVENMFTPIYVNFGSYSHVMDLTT